MGVMGGTLLVSGSDKGREFLLQLLKEEDCQPVTPAASGDEARRLITQCDFDLILINAPAAGGKGPLPGGFRRGKHHRRRPPSG